MSLATGDEDAIRRVLDDYLESWNRCDATACAELYDRTGDLLAVDGTFLRSHAQIKQYYDDNLSGKYAGFQARSVEILGVREVGAGGVAGRYLGGACAFCQRRSIGTDCEADWELCSGQEQ